ncbi:S1C family serine protease [Micromonospora sp. CPCC 206061]|uniref:S1C family serine protease n=1 Tax=Micromonospora sp. CPCC 206061 TaxID=3122410 RepID=UPI002FF361B4
MIIGSALVALVALALVAVVSFRWGASDTPAVLPTVSPEPTAVEELTAKEVYDTVAPSVVIIEALDAGGKTTATGTGVIASAQGVILTALHVVKGAGGVRVTFADGTQSAATVRAADEEIDVAALAAATLPQIVVPAVLGSSGRLSVGDGVVAVGNQLGMVRSATTGVVSGLDRSATGTGGLRLSGLIQFDAAVNPGSSGGPLVNTRGETVGIVVALANPTTAGTFIGIGFAVPIGAAAAAGGGDGPQQ